MNNYKHYLLNAPRKEENAFLKGCRTMMEIFAHADSEDYPYILSRKDKNWILYLCEIEAERNNTELCDMAQVIAKYCQFNRQEFRGMLLDCLAVNDKGQAIDKEGNPVAEKCPHSYPHKFYQELDGDEYSKEEYDTFSPEDQDQCQEIPFITIKTGNKTQRIGLYNQPYMKALLERIIPDEPEIVIELYLEEMQKEEMSPALKLYEDTILETITKRITGSFNEITKNLFSHIGGAMVMAPMHSNFVRSSTDTGDNDDSNKATTGANEEAISNDNASRVHRPYEVEN